MQLQQRYSTTTSSKIYNARITLQSPEGPIRLSRSRVSARHSKIPTLVSSLLTGSAEATRNRALQLRYLVRLYVKELVLKNFAGLPPDQLLERMIELSLYAEEKLKSG
jgi:hypothetical protein